MRTELEIKVELEGLIKESANIAPADLQLKADAAGWIAALKWTLEPSITGRDDKDAAVEAERGSCAQILELEAARYEAGNPGPIERKVAELLLTLATKIRARSEGPIEPPE